MSERLNIKVVVENGQPHYKISDTKTGNIIHCDFNELNETIYELIGA